MKNIKRLTSLILMAALAFSGAVVDSGNTAAARTQDPICIKADDTSAVSGASVSFGSTTEDLLRLIAANRMENIDLDTYGEVRMSEYMRNEDATELYVMEAQRVKKDKKEAEYHLYDIEGNGQDEMFITYPAGVRTGLVIYTFDSLDSIVIKLKTFNGISAIKKDKKKKQIVLAASSGANDYCYYRYKLNSAGKLKKTATLTHRGKLYKKNKKEISAEKFNKLEKAINKLPELKTKSIPKAAYNEVELSDVNYWSKDLYCNVFFYDDYVSGKKVEKKDTLVMQKGSTESQDKYLAYTFTHDLQKNGLYEGDPVITRYVFGPDVVNPKTGKTYQQQDWEQMRLDLIGRVYACGEIASGKGEYGKDDIPPFYEDDVKKLEVKDGTVTNGEKTYASKDYYVDTEGMCYCYKFIAEGEYIGRVAEVTSTFADEKNDIPFLSWDFDYGSEGIENRPEWDPAIGISVIGKGAENGIPDAGNRNLTITATIDGKKDDYKIVTGNNVRYELFISDTGEFLSYLDDGSKYGKPLLLPAFYADEKTRALTDKWLNPVKDKKAGTYGDASYPKSLFWEPVKPIELANLMGEDIESAKIVFPHMQCIEEMDSENYTRIAYQNVSEYAEDLVTLAGPFFEVDVNDMTVKQIDYSGFRHTLAGVQAGMSMKRAAEIVKADGWTFRDVEFAHGTASPVLNYVKDDMILCIVSDREGDFNKKTEEENIKKGTVFGITLLFLKNS